MDKIAEMIGSVRKKGVRLWAENGQLHYRAPKGALTQEEIERLRFSRAQIVALLERTISAGPDGSELMSHFPLAHAPLAFSQLAHWNLYQLSERRAIRQIASATRLRGQFNLSVLRESVEEILRRHDALRTRIVVQDGVPMQEVSSSSQCELSVDDLTALRESSRELEVNRQIEQFILEPIDVAVGPLLGIKLLKLRDDEHVLIVAMEHIISDMFSMNILLRDLFTAYMQASKGNLLCLPRIAIHFSEYSAWQHHTQDKWMEKHGAYWNEHLKGCQRLRFPEDESVQAMASLGWSKISFQIGRDVRVKLVEWCRLRRSTLVMCVFTAYVALVLRWCHAPESVVRYQSNGRTSPDTENTIGYFAFPLYLRIAIHEKDTFVDLMNRVTEEYCRAHEHADYSFMSAQVPRSELTRNTIFNWIPAGSKTNLPRSHGSDNALTCSPVSFEHPMLRNLEIDCEPFVEALETDGEIVCEVYFPANRFSADTMERFGRNFLLFLEVLQNQSEIRVKDILLR